MMKNSSVSLTILVALSGCADNVGPRTAGSNTTLSSTKLEDHLTPESTSMDKKIVRSEEEWQKLLTPQQYYVLREKGTERPYTNEYDHHFEPGSYACAACGQELFESETKFNSGCGWPAFYAAKAKDRVVLTSDRSLGMVRTEVTCRAVESHLGHIFDDAPQTPTGQRYCINSVSIKFIPAEKTEHSPAGD